MLGYKEKVPGIASHINRQRLGRREHVVPPCVWRDVHRMIAECHEVLLTPWSRQHGARRRRNRHPRAAKAFASFDPVLEREEFALFYKLQKFFQIFWQNWATISHSDRSARIKGFRVSL